MSNIVTRFAPSPTGHLHIGGARTALFCWLLARHYGGVFRLRIEDTDRERSKQEYTDSILASMRWLGLDWDDELTYQSKRTDLYNAAVDQLLETGHAYWCSCTPDEVEAMREAARAKGESPRYDGRCREKKLGPAQGSVVRLKVPAQGSVVLDDMVKGRIVTDMAQLDDMVLRKSDGMPTYNMAVVVDDHDMGVTHVVRGDDHVSNTPKQILLFQALGWDLPVFGHVPMILGPDRQKLSKRHGARAVVEYQDDGLLPHALVNCLVRLGWSHGDQELFTLSELVELFDGKNLNSAASAFDFKRLAWLNGHYIRESLVEDLAELVLPFVQREGFHVTAKELVPLLPLYKERAEDLLQLAKSLTVLLCDADKLSYDEKAVAKAFTAESAKHLTALRERFAMAESFEPAAIEQSIHDYIESEGLAFKAVGPCMRVALAGSLGGPGLPEFIATLGKEQTLARLDLAVSYILSKQ